MEKWKDMRGPKGDPKEKKAMQKETQRGVPKIGVPQNGWFIMENLIKMDDLGENPLFSETPIYCNLRIFIFFLVLHC